MGGAEGGAAVGCGAGEGGRGHEGVAEEGVDIVGGGVRGMAHVGGVEAVVAEVVFEGFVGGEVGATGAFCGEEQCGFREIVGVEATLSGMAHGAYGPNRCGRGVDAGEDGGDAGKGFGGFRNGEAAFGECGGMVLVAVADNHAAFGEAKHAV